MFAGYVNCFLKLKAEASGWPSNVETEEQRSAYVKEYFEREGVQLDKDNVKKNPGLRSLAKLALNSFWVLFTILPIFTFLLFYYSYLKLHKNE